MQYSRYVSSSDDEDLVEGDGSHKRKEDSDGSDVSFDEGEYDGSLGEVTYTGKADMQHSLEEAGENQLSLSDQNIRQM